MAQMAPTVPGTLPRSPRFHGQSTVNTEFDVPPSIDSLDLPPFKPRFPWWGADLQTLSVLLQSSASDMSPHTSERVCFPMADRTGDILLGMLDRPEERDRGPSAGDPGPRPDRLRGQRLHPERGAPSARSGLSGPAPQRTRRRPLARLLRRALSCRPHRGLPPGAVAAARGRDPDGMVAIGYSWAARCC